ncbi:MAG: iron uptake protein [Spongiibacteraceae bacterium]
MSSSSHIASRVAASLLGGYAFSWGFTVFGITLLVWAGMSYHEAQTLVFMLAFLVFLVVFCWAFAAARVARVWGVLAGGGAAMTAAAWWLTRTLQ